MKYRKELKNKIVSVFMEGGVIQNIEMTKGITVRVYDYDIEGVDLDRIEKDGLGEECTIAEWKQEKKEEKKEENKIGPLEELLVKSQSILAHCEMCGTDSSKLLEPAFDPSGNPKILCQQCRIGSAELLQEKWSIK